MLWSERYEFLRLSEVAYFANRQVAIYDLIQEVEPLHVGISAILDTQVPCDVEKAHLSVDLNLETSRASGAIQLKFIELPETDTCRRKHTRETGRARGSVWPRRGRW